LVVPESVVSQMYSGISADLSFEYLLLSRIKIIWSNEINFVYLSKGRTVVLKSGELLPFNSWGQFGEISIKVGYLI